MFLKLLVVTTVLVQSGLVQAQVLSVDKGTFTLTVAEMRPKIIGNILVDVTIDGTIRNDTGFDYDHLYLEFIAYDAEGQNLMLCDTRNLGQKCDVRIFDPITAGQTVRLKAPGNVFIPVQQRLLKGVKKGVWRVVEAPYRVKYRVESSPVANEHFTIAPVFDTRGIALEFRSISDVLEVSWDQSVYIDETGNSSRLIRSNVRLIEKDRPQPNTVIPPGTKLRETVFPIDRIKQDKDGSLYQVGLFPEIVQNGASDKAALSSLVGKEVRLFLRLLVNDQKQNVTIPFKVVQVDY